MAKKTNYISIEIERFEKHINELMEYLDDNSPATIEDRTETIPARTEGGAPTIKIISTREAQIKSYRDSLKEIPALLSALNTLRKEVDGAKEDVAVRGGQETPGFMDDEEDDEDEKPAPVAPIIVAPSKTDKPVKRAGSALAGDDDDDEDVEPIKKPKKDKSSPTPWESDEVFDED